MKEIYRQHLKFLMFMESLSYEAALILFKKQLYCLSVDEFYCRKLPSLMRTDGRFTVGTEWWLHMSREGRHVI